jgi:hypothetical protein
VVILGTIEEVALDALHRTQVGTNVTGIVIDMKDEAILDHINPDITTKSITKKGMILDTIRDIAIEVIHRLHQHRVLVIRPGRT